MLKIKKQLPLASIDETEYNKNQEDIKSSIKKLYISNQSKKKTINEYAQLATQIREEYAKLQAKCAQLENALQKYKDYVENRWSPPAPPNIQRKRVFKKPKIPYYHQYDDIEKGYTSADEREDNDEYFDYESKPKPKRKKRIVYVDEIDGDDEDEIKEPEEVIEKDEDEEYVKVVKKRKRPVGKKTPNKEMSKKVGITKSI